MDRGIFTNQFHAEYDYDAIDRDFDIYVLTKSDSKMNYNLLDTPSVKYKATAVQYMYGKNVLVLFKKGIVDEYDYRMEIQGGNTDITVKKIDLFDEDERDKCFFFNDRLLAQLLLNSLSNSLSDKRTYHNLTGKLLYLRPEWIKRRKNITYSFYTLEAAFRPGMYLTLKVKSFYRSTNGKYVFDENTGALRKRLKADDKLDSFSEGGSYNGKHNTVPYLDISNICKFSSCRLGVLKKLLDDVDKKLSKYMSLTPICIQSADKYDVSKEQEKAMDPVHLSKLIDAPIYITDELGTDESAEIAEKIKLELNKYYGLKAAVGELHSNAFNIRIIHDKEFYEENALPDLHKNIPKNLVVQHLTIENALEAKLLSDKDKKKAHPMINKLLQELVIKRDILKGYITVFDWKNIGYDRDVSFVIREKLNDNNSEPHINAAGKKEKYWYEYTLLSISADGMLKFESFSDNDKQLSELHNKIIRAYELSDNNTFRYNEEVEGLVYFDPNNIHSIIRTPMSTMPDINAIWNGLEETDPEVRIEKLLLLDALTAFETECCEYADYASYLKNAFEQCDDSIKKSEINKIMDYKHHQLAFKKLNRFLHKNYGIRINSEIKSKDFGDEYLLNNILDIKHYIEENEKGMLEFKYFVGTKSNALQTSVHNACAVRKVVSETGNLEFSSLLPLMAVDFVRNNQYTVLPFPFKFLREY